MKKKTNAAVAPTEIETMPQATSSDGTDPTLLGVSVPLTVTFAAVKQVTDAWRECLLALSVAVKAKVLPPEASSPVATEAPAASPTVSA